MADLWSFHEEMVQAVQAEMMNGRVAVGKKRRWGQRRESENVWNDRPLGAHLPSSPLRLWVYRCLLLLHPPLPLPLPLHTPLDR